MKLKLSFVSILFIAIFISSCAPTASDVSGTYTGEYITTSTTYYNITAAVSSENSNTVTILFSGIGITDLTVSGITVSTTNNVTSLTKAAGSETLSGVVHDNELNVTYSTGGTNISYVGSK